MSKGKEVIKALRLCYIFKFLMILISYGQLNLLGIFLTKIQKELSNSWSATRIKTPNKTTFSLTPKIKLDLELHIDTN